MIHENKEYFCCGFLLGITVTIILVILCKFLVWLNDPMDVSHPNQVLNSSKYTIDTIKIINGVDTVTTYQFRHVK